MPERVSVTVDPMVCEGTTFCVRSLPRIFSLSDDGVAQVDEEQVGAVSVDELHEVENMCPTTAISVEDQG